MCGIAGAIDLKGRRDFAASRLLAMTGAITHRGPDDEQIHIEPGVAMKAAKGFRSSTWPAAGSRSATKTARSGSPRTVSCSNTPSFSRRSWLVATGWQPGATPSCGPISTKITARDSSGEGAARASSRSPSGTAKAHFDLGAIPWRRYLPRSTTRRLMAGCSGALKSKHCLLPG